MEPELNLQWVEPTPGNHNFYMSVNAPIVREKTLRTVVPVCFNGLFDQHEVQIIESTGLTPCWILEYVMCVWLKLDFNMRHNQDDDIFEFIVDDIHSHLSEDVISHSDHLVTFGYVADYIVNMCKRTFGIFKPYLNNIVEGDRTYQLLAANVEKISTDFITLLFVYDDRGDYTNRLFEFNGSDWQLKQSPVDTGNWYQKSFV